VGNMQSAALAGAVADGTASLRQALAIQVGSNFYPPLPVEYIELGMKALEEPNSFIRIPEDLNPKPRAAWEDVEEGWLIDGWTLINIMHLEPFMADYDEEE
jgi:hypothetical protein